MSAPSGVRVTPGACTACRACELACHYHHTGAFGTARRSLHVRFHADSGALQIEFDETCDGCLKEESPRCVFFCAPGALRLAA